MYNYLNLKNRPYIPYLCLAEVLLKKTEMFMLTFRSCMVIEKKGTTFSGKKREVIRYLKLNHYITGRTKKNQIEH